MSLSILQDGSEIAVDLRGSSRISGHRPVSVTTLRDVLDALETDPPPSYGMLRSTVARFSEFKSQPADRIRIECLKLERDDFKDYLNHSKYAQNSIRSYLNYSRILSGIATKMGWSSPLFTIPPDWSDLEPQIIRALCQGLVLHLVRIGRRPDTVHEDDLKAWVEKEVRQGRSWGNAHRKAGSLRRMIVKAGYVSDLSVKKTRRNDYGIAFDRFPEPLKAEVQDVLRWKQDRYVPARPKGAKVRAVTAQNIRRSFERLFGFAVNVDGNRDISTLRQLVTEEIITRFIGWAFEDRGLRSNSVAVMLGSICAAVNGNPRYAQITQTWFPTIMRTLPDDSDEEAMQRKEERSLPYETLTTIPDGIRHDCSKIGSDEPHRTAMAVRDELLIKWLLVLPWRQRNLRECRIGGSNPNLFKGPLPALSAISKPHWLLEAESRGEGKEVWQFRFEPVETKTGNRIHCVLPRSLITLLEEYLHNHRPHLVQGADPGTLFLNNDGTPLSQATLRNRVSALTVKYGGRLVNPHLFRDIFAFMWLELIPQDYLTVSKLLWHRNIQTTINIYGRKFNESAALCRMEKVLGL
jgi:integrase